MSTSAVSVSQKRSLLNLAYKGDPEAIAAILRSYCKYRGTKATHVQVRCNGKNLLILCESDTEVEQQDFVQPFQQILRKLGINVRYQVTLYGRLLGQTKPLWSVALETKAKASAVELEHWLNQGKEQPSVQPENLGNIENWQGNFQRNSNRAPKSRFLRFKLDLTAKVFHSDPNIGELNRERSILLPLAEIREVLDIPKTSVLPVPYMATSVLGIYNYRGNMLWLVDLAQQLGDRSFLTDSSHHPTLSILVVCREDGELMGLAVSEVLDIEDHTIEELEFPNAALFPESFSPFIEYYLPQSLSPILSIQALIRDTKLQYH